MSRAVGAAREAFDDGPWPRLTHAERAEYLRALGAELARAGRRPRPDLAARVRRAARHRPAAAASARSGPSTRYAGAGRHVPVRGAGQAVGRGEFGLLVREPVGVVGAIIPWNAPMGLISNKIAPGAARRVHGRPQVLARGARRGVPGRRGGRGDRAAAGRAQRGHRRPRGLRAARPRPARRQDHLHRVDRGRAADRLDLRRADRPLHARARRQVGRRHPRRRRPRDRRASTLAQAECFLSGQVCSSLTRIVVTRHRHDELVEALAAHVLPGAGRRPVRRRRPRWARWPPSGSATGSRATSPRASPRARRSPPAAAARRTSTAAGSSSRPCSATSTTRRPSRRRRSSGRC